MAIYNGPLGSKMRGKVGEIVAAKTVGGQTALRSYQPVVKNPNTLRQRVSRSKIAQASTIAAGLSEVIKIGYAMSVKGAKMYARNMFVRELIPQGNGYFTVTNGVVARSTKPLPVSKAAGLTIIPYCVQSAGENEAVVVTAQNIDQVLLSTGEKAAMVAVGVNVDNFGCVVKTAVKPVSGDTSVEFSSEEMDLYGVNEIYVFYKVVPEAFNGVPSNEIPWKYPSPTSVSVKLG